MRFYAKVGIRWFPKDGRIQRAIVLSFNEEVKEGDTPIFFFFTCELNARVDIIKAFLEGLMGS